MKKKILKKSGKNTLWIDYMPVILFYLNIIK